MENSSNLLENHASIKKHQGDSKPIRTIKTESGPKRAVALTTAKTETKLNSSNFANSEKPKCVVCSQFYLLIDCDPFKIKSPKQRYDILKAKPICRNCLKSNHQTNECRRPCMCKQCNQPYHTLLHFESHSVVTPNEPREAATLTSNSNSTASCLSINQSPLSSSSLLTLRKLVVLLPSEVVPLQCCNVSGDLRVLLDSCSQINLVSSSSTAIIFLCK